MEKELEKKKMMKKEENGGAESDELSEDSIQFDDVRNYIQDMITDEKGFTDIWYPDDGLKADDWLPNVED